MTRRWALAGAVALLFHAGEARAATQYKVEPGVSLGAGYDDNVLFDNRGGDQIGRGLASLHLVAFDHLWHATANLSGQVLGFNDRQKAVWLGETLLHGYSRVNRDTRLIGHLRLRAADDPLALAQVGLLAAEGRALGFRSYGTVERRIDREWTLQGTLSFDGVRFLDQAVAKDGQAAGLALIPRYRVNRELTFQPSLEGRLFFTGGGLLAETAGVLPGVRYRVARRTFVEAAAGPEAYVDDLGPVWLPAARLKAEKGWRFGAVELTAAHDLTVPAGRGGVLAGELVEGLGRFGDRDWELRARAGYYRSHPSPRSEEWVPGYGAEASAFRHLFSGVWLGVTALRFERLATAFEPSLARDAVYMRLDFTGDRP